jgi:hypothetical protein
MWFSTPYARRAKTGGAWLLAWALVLPVAHALTPSAAVRNTLPAARLAGQGDMRWLGIPLYAAQLWTTAPAQTAHNLHQAPFALELRYAVRISGTTLAESSTQEITRLGWGDAQARQRWHEAMQRVFPDVTRGDRLTGLHVPGQGAQFFFNDRPVGRIDDPVFSQAFFAIWLDPRTQAPQLRQALLRELAAPGSPP